MLLSSVTLSKMSKGKDAKSATLTYLTHQNRPYSTNDIVANLHNEHAKSVVQKALDLLVAEGSIIEKLNGKQKAYVANQNNLPVASEEELTQLDAELTAAQAELTSMTQQCKSKEESLKMMRSQLTTESAVKQLEEVTQELVKLENRLKGLTEQGNMVTQDEMNQAKKLHQTSVKEWRKRKRMFENVTDAILDGYPKPKKTLYEEIGVDTDQDVGATMPQI